MNDQVLMNKDLMGEPDKKPMAMVRQIDGLWYVCFDSNSPYYDYFKANMGRAVLDYSGNDAEKIVPKVRKDFPGHSVYTEITRNS